MDGFWQGVALDTSQMNRTRGFSLTTARPSVFLPSSMATMAVAVCTFRYMSLTNPDGVDFTLVDSFSLVGHSSLGIDPTGPASPRGAGYEICASSVFRFVNARASVRGRTDTKTERRLPEFGGMSSAC